MPISVRLDYSDQTRLFSDLIFHLFHIISDCVQINLRAYPIMLIHVLTPYITHLFLFLICQSLSSAFFKHCPIPSIRSLAKTL